MPQIDVSMKAGQADFVMSRLLPFIHDLIIPVEGLNFTTILLFL